MRVLEAELRDDLLVAMALIEAVAADLDPTSLAYAGLRTAKERIRVVYDETLPLWNVDVSPGHSVKVPDR